MTGLSFDETTPSDRDAFPKPRKTLNHFKIDKSIGNDLFRLYNNSV